MLFKLNEIFNKIKGFFSSKQSTEVVNIVVQKDSISDVILARCGEFSVEDIAIETGCSKHSVRAVCRRLADKGILVKVREAVWIKKSCALGSTVSVFNSSDVISSHVLGNTSSDRNELLRSLILSKKKMFTVPSLRGETREDASRIQRVVAGLVKEGLVVKTTLRDKTYTTGCKPIFYHVKGV